MATVELVSAAIDGEAVVGRGGGLRKEGGAEFCSQLESLRLSKPGREGGTGGWVGEGVVVGGGGVLKD